MAFVRRPSYRDTARAAPASETLPETGHPLPRDRTGKVYPKLPFAARETSPSVTLARLSYLAIAGRNYRDRVASPSVKLSPRQW